MVSQDAVGNNRQVFAACPCSVTRVGFGSKPEKLNASTCFPLSPESGL